MRLGVYGSARGKHVAVIGVWDPITPNHEKLYRDTVAQASRSDLKTMVVTLDPTPAAQMWGRLEVPSFDAITARVYIQRKCGVQTNVVAHLRRDEIYEGGAEYFLSRLCERVSVSKLILGAGQSLGRGPRGSVRTILEYCSEHGIDVERLSPPSRRWSIPGARNALRRGHLGTCVNILGRPLFWSRPRSQYAVLPWIPGRYRAIPCPAPVSECVSGSAIDIQLQSFTDRSRFQWPDRAIRWLAFVEGPGDLTGADI
jgi:FAD synthase